MLTVEDNAGTSKTRRIPHAYPEVALPEPAMAWFQILHASDWEIASGRITALHLDCQGLRLQSGIPMQRGTLVVVNATVPGMGTLYVRGEVTGVRKEVRRNLAVIRFQHLAEMDRQALREHISELTTRSEQPVPLREDRRYRRFVKSLQVEYQVCTPGGKRTPGKGQMVTLDIGGGGFKFRIDQKLNKGDTLYVRLPLQGQHFFSLGRVAWVEKSRVEGRYMAGLQFLDLSDVERERLVRYLARPAEERKT